MSGRLRKSTKDMPSNSAFLTTLSNVSPTMLLLRSGMVRFLASHCTSNHMMARCGFGCAGRLARKKEFGRSISGFRGITLWNANSLGPLISTDRWRFAPPN